MLAQVFPCSNEMNIIYIGLAFAADNHVANCGRSRNTRGTQLSQKRSPTRLPTNYPPRLAPGTKVPPLVRTGAFNWDWPNYLHSERRSKIVSCKAQKIDWLGSLPTGAGHDRRPPFGLIPSVRMPQRIFFRLALPAIASLLVGFLALAWTSTSESTIPVWVVSLVSPGLKIAELAMPAAHESLAWTFGWFLRISIGVNAVFYFAIFALIAYLFDRRRSRNSEQV